MNLEDRISKLEGKTCKLNVLARYAFLLGSAVLAALIFDDEDDF